MDPIRLFNEEDYEFHLEEFKRLKQGGKCRLNEDDFDDLIDYFHFRGDWENTREAFHYATALFPYSSMLLQKKIEWLQSHNKIGQALKLAEKLRILDPDNVQSILLHASILIESEQTGLAADILEDALTKAKESERAILTMELSELYFELNEFQKGLDHILNLLEAQPLNEYALESLPFWAKECDKESLVISFLKGLLDEHPLHSYAWNRLGLIYKFHKDYPKAIDAYENCIAIDDKDEEAHGYLSRCYIKLEKYDQAIEVLQDFKEFAQPLNGIYEKIAFCYEMKGEAVLARNYYRRSLKINPEQYKIYLKIGKTYMKEEQWEKAIKSFSVAFQMNPDKVATSVCMGKALFEYESFEEALTAFLHAVQLNNKNKSNQLLLLKTLYFLNYWNEALVQLKLARENAGFKIEFDYYEAAIYLAMGKHQEAKNIFESALEEDVKKAHCLDNLDEALLKHPIFASILSSFN